MIRDLHGDPALVTQSLTLTANLASYQITDINID